MKKSPQPVFPALLVEDDGGLEVLLSNTEWTDDIDHWFWSSSDVFLIDQRLNQFDPVANRSRDGRPTEIPEWHCSATITPDVIEGLIAADPDSDPDDPAFASFIRYRTSN